MLDLGAPLAGNGGEPSPRLPSPPSTRRSVLGRWFDSWMRSLGMAVVLFLIIRTFLLEAFQIPSGSMERTLLAGDFLFVIKAVYGAQIPGTNARLPAFHTPHRGDVMVFAYPKDPTLSYVKRVIGGPGDVVEMRQGQVYVNGRMLDESYVQRKDPLHDQFDPEFNWQREYLVRRTDEQLRRYHPTRDTWGPLRVPDDKYFVLGAIRTTSSNSRYWAFVKPTPLKGRRLVA